MIIHALPGVFAPFERLGADAHTRFVKRVVEALTPEERRQITAHYDEHENAEVAKALAMIRGLLHDTPAPADAPPLAPPTNPAPNDAVAQLRAAASTETPAAKAAPKGK
jgi:hypothetical protein